MFEKISKFPKSFPLREIRRLNYHNSGGFPDWPLDPAGVLLALGADGLAGLEGLPLPVQLHLSLGQLGGGAAGEPALEA